jgi:Tfp pilus assembly protein PilN
MIQFNLLPDIKLEYIKTRRTKRSIIVISLAVAGVALGIFILLFMTVNVLQKQHISNLNKDIKKHSSDLEGIEDLDRILTVQNQLNKLTELHDSKPVISRFKGYISQITPAQVSYASITLDVANGTINFTGSADSLRTVNQFVDTLKFTKYTIGDETEQKNAFSEVVLTGFGKDEKGASYEIDLKFDPIIFSSQSDVKLIVPSIVTTRSAVERPDDNLLIPLSNPDESTGGQ